jgi:hypothetical protein
MLMDLICCIRCSPSEHQSSSRPLRYVRKAGVLPNWQALVTLRAIDVCVTAGIQRNARQMKICQRIIRRYAWRGRVVLCACSRSDRCQEYPNRLMLNGRDLMCPLCLSIRLTLISNIAQHDQTRLLGAPYRTSGGQPPDEGQPSS